VLSDHRTLNSVSDDTLDVYSRPENLHQIGAVHGSKVAELIRLEHKEFLRFLETVCINRDDDFMIFYESRRDGMVFKLNDCICERAIVLRLSLQLD